MRKVEKIYNLKIIKSGDRLEIYRFNNYALRNDYESIRNTEETILDGEQLELKNINNLFEEAYIKEMQAKNTRKKTLHKSQNSIMRLIQSNSDMTTFITLTFAIEQDYKSSKKELNNFFNKLRRFSQGLKYLWVLEYGEKNNRLHYHVLTNLFNNLDLKVDGVKSIEHKSLETKFMSKFWNNLGFVDIRDFKQKDNINVALYVSAYITKSLQDLNLHGYRVYGYSCKTLNKPIEKKVYCKESLEEILKKYPEYKIKYQNSYEIGFETWNGKRRGSVTYLDLYKKGDNEYENK